MNPRRELYVSGASLAVAHVIQRRTGRRVAVLDPHRRTRAAVVAMLLRGVKPRDVARALDIPFGTVCALGISGLSMKKKIQLTA